MNFFLLLHKRINGWYVFLISILTLIFSFMMVGVIPVNGGTGWDGNAYFNIIEDLVTNGWHVNDPYRTIRLTAFPHLLVLLDLGLTKQEIVLFQVGFNIFMFALANVAIYRSIIELNLGKTKAIAACCVLLFTWPVMVMTNFYPILGDHIALAISCYCLWAWAINSRALLLFFCFYSVWIFPSLFFIPLLLLAFPGKDPVYFENRGKKKVIIIIATVIIAAILSLLLIDTINENDYWRLAATHGADTSGNRTAPLTSLPQFMGVSLIICVGFIFIFIWNLLQLVINTVFWQRIDFLYSTLALVTAIASFFLMRHFIDFDNGFAGPPIIQFLIFQGLSAPGKSIIAHFLYFGPVFLLVYYALIKGKNLSLPLPIVVILLAYMMPLAFGSESRQWLVVLPFIALAGIFLSWGPVRALITVVFTWLILIPMVGIKFSINKALAFHDGLQDSTWQNYFAYQGPWMSIAVYKVAVALFVIFILAYSLASYIDRRLLNNPSAK